MDNWSIEEVIEMAKNRAIEEFQETLEVYGKEIEFHQNYDYRIVLEKIEDK